MEPKDVAEDIAEELSRSLQGSDLGRAILDRDLCHGLDMGWLTENGVLGQELFEILCDNGELSELPADVLTELFSGSPLVDALEATGAHADLSDSDLLAALDDDPAQALRALRLFGRLDIPESPRPRLRGGP